jgi:hypothetical protein
MFKELWLKKSGVTAGFKRSHGNEDKNRRRGYYQKSLNVGMQLLKIN